MRNFLSAGDANAEEAGETGEEIPEDDVDVFLEEDEDEDEGIFDVNTSDER